MKVTRMGAIGYGYWGPNLIRNFVEISSSEMLAIADLCEKRLAHARERHPQIRYTTKDYLDLFSMDLDAVVVATPPQSHFKLVSECLTQGLHVLVEKPLTLSTMEAAELVRIAKEQDRTLMVGHTFEYNPAVRALKRMIDNGELGKIHYIDAVRVSLGLFSSQLNVVWDLAPHDISILRYLLGTDPVYVCAQGNCCVQPGIEDVAYVTLRFPDDVLAQLRLSWLDPCKTRRITVVGSEKMVIYDDVESQEKIKVYDKRVDALRHTDTYGEFDFAYHYGDIVSPFIRFDEPLRIECLHFLECVREGKQPQSNGESGLGVVKIIEAAQRSLKNGNGVVQFTNGIQRLSEGISVDVESVTGA